MLNQATPSLEDFESTYRTINHLLMLYAPPTEMWGGLMMAREMVAREVCEQYGYKAMVDLTSRANALPTTGNSEEEH